MRLRRVALVAAGLAGQGAALADAPTFSWSRGVGASSCPARVEVLASLERALGAPLDARLEGRSLEAVVVREAEAWRATLWWRDRVGALLGTRSITVAAGDCEAVMAATRASVVVALRSGVFEGAGEPDPTPPQPELVVAPPSPVRVVSPQPVVVTSAPPETRSPRRDEGPSRAVSLAGELGVGWLPGVAWGASLHVEAFARGRLRVNARVAALAESPVDAASSATFAAVEFGADVCAVPLRAGVFELDGCVGARAGVVQGFGYARDVPTRGGRGSFAATLALAARFDVGPVAVALEPALRWNVTRASVARDDGTVLAEQPALGFALSLRVGWRFR